MSIREHIERFASNRQLINAKIDGFRVNPRSPQILEAFNVEVNAIDPGGVDALGTIIGADLLQMLMDVRAIEYAAAGDGEVGDPSGDDGDGETR